MRAAVLTRRGYGRRINQDRVVVNNTIVASDLPKAVVFPAEPPCLVAVLDGLGGHPAGELASVLAAGVVASGWAQTETGFDVAAVVEEANGHLYRTMFAYPDLRYMGSTIAGVLIHADTVTVFWVGDSRAYLHAGGGLEQVTVDDWDPAEGLITQTLGGYGSFHPIKVHVRTEHFTGGRIVVATDGLFGETDTDALAEAVSGPLETAPDRLSRVAIESGNPDDFSVVVVG